VHATVAFQPVSPDELKMTSEPMAPGAPAIILYRQVDRDDNGRYRGGMGVGSFAVGRYEDNYFRIKILTEEGRRYADVEIAVSEFVGTVGAINARTIRPDGTIVNFDGKVFDKTISKRKGFKYAAKTFTLPDVQVGSIIEYYYTLNFTEGWIFSSQWRLSHELFTRKAKFSLKPFHNDYGQMSLRRIEHLPPGAPEPNEGADGVVHLEVSNVEAFREEDFMPPDNELVSQVYFVYSGDEVDPDPAKFWKKIGKRRNEEMDRFVGRRGAMEQAVAQIVAPGDSPDAKLEKIYVRVQQLRNTSYEVQKTEVEKKRENQKPVDSVEEVWKQGYGDEWQLNWLFLGLARAAGFDASGVLVADRREEFFKPETEISWRLNGNVVLVKSSGKDLYLDPGSAFTPFGLLRWDKTGVPGLRIDKDGGTWIQTPVPDSSASHMERKASLKLSDNGDLEGKLTVIFTGLEALHRRVEQRNEDAAARKKSLEDEVKQSVPVASEVDLSNQPDWKSSSSPLVAEFQFKVPGWASNAGRRELLPVGLFAASEKHLFDHAERIHPVYFESQNQKLDDVSIELPAGWQVASLPQPQDHNLRVVAYTLGASNNSSTVRLTRKLDINIVMLETKYYSPLRSFFQMVKSGDEGQVVLQRGATAASN
jgi:hypothetical protein